MARLEEQYDPRGQDRGQAPGDVIASGFYLSRITASEIKKTKDGTGNYIEFEHTLESQGVRGRKVWSRLNRRNKSEVAERIGREEFARLCDAVGMGDVVIVDTAQLHDKLMAIKVVIEKDNNGNDRNEVKGYFDKSKAQGTAAPAAGPAQPPAPAWQKPAAQAPAPAPAAAPAQDQGQPPAPAPAPAAAATKKPWEK